MNRQTKLGLLVINTDTDITVGDRTLDVTLVALKAPITSIDKTYTHSLHIIGCNQSVAITDAEAAYIQQLRIDRLAAEAAVGRQQDADQAAYMAGHNRVVGLQTLNGKTF